MKLNNLLFLNTIFSRFKKERLIFQFLFFLFCKPAFSQQIANYVSNSSFEILNANAAAYEPEATKFWTALDTTKQSNLLCSALSTISNVPYVSTGFQYPRTGNNFVLVQFYCDNCGNNSRYYPRNRLKQKLQVGKTYCAKYYVVNTNNNRVAIANYGMYFGDSSLDTITKCMWPITYLTPQIENTTGIIIDTLNWIPITGTFVANGTEKYMVLGNFKSNAATTTLQLNTPTLSTQSTDLYIDDVSVIDIDLPAYAGPDIWGIPTNTVYIGRPQDVGIDEACMWYKLPNTTTAIDTAAGITITVAATTQTYMVKQTICGNIKYDTVVVYASGLGFASSSGVENNVKIYPNPANEILTIEFVTLSGVEASNTTYSIINSLGQIVREEVLRHTSASSVGTAQQPNGTFTATINTKDLANGVYLLNLSSRGTRDLNTDSSYSRNDNTVSVSKRFVIAR
jgi:hypothetical protein